VIVEGFTEISQSIDIQDNEEGGHDQNKGVVEEGDLSLSFSLSRIQWMYACGLVSMIIRVRGMVVLRKIVLAVIIRERQR
jgi:hypothetical protein